jgi:hypothetical protein
VLDGPGLLEAGRYRSISSVRTILHTACRILLLPRHRLEYYSYTDHRLEYYSYLSRRMEYYSYIEHRLEYYSYTDHRLHGILLILES